MHHLCSTSTAMNGTSEFPGNSLERYEENPISGRYPILDTCRIGPWLNATNEFPGNACLAFMAVDVEQKTTKMRYVNTTAWCTRIT